MVTNRTVCVPKILRRFGNLEHVYRLEVSDLLSRSGHYFCSSIVVTAVVHMIDLALTCVCV